MMGSEMKITLVKVWGYCYISVVQAHAGVVQW